MSTLRTTCNAPSSCLGLHKVQSSKPSYLSNFSVLLLMASILVSTDCEGRRQQSAYRTLHPWRIWLILPWILPIAAQCQWCFVMVNRPFPKQIFTCGSLLPSGKNHIIFHVHTLHHMHCLIILTVSPEGSSFTTFNSVKSSLMMFCWVEDVHLNRRWWAASPKLRP